jgi:hypothetical protein
MEGGPPSVRYAPIESQSVRHAHMANATMPSRTIARLPLLFPLHRC